MSAVLEGEFLHPAAAAPELADNLQIEQRWLSRILRMRKYSD